MTPLPPAGWYPDPSDATRRRWWDGKGWTDHTTDQEPQQPPYRAPVASAPVSAPWVRPPDTGGVATGTPWRPSWSGSPEKIGLVRHARAFRYRNAASVSAMTAALAYAAIGYFFHFFFLGLFPIAMAVGALRRHERLAPLALVVAAAPLVLFLLVHFRR